MKKTHGLQAKPWTERHIAEARAVFCDAAKTSILRGSDNDTRALDGARLVSPAPSSEAWFRDYLSYVDGFGQNSAIDAAVRRVRARAEGREVVEVETRWRVRHVDGLYEPRPGLGEDEVEEHAEADDAWWTDDHDTARDIAECANDGARVVKVTLTRRRRVRVKVSS